MRRFESFGVELAHRVRRRFDERHFERRHDAMARATTRQRGDGGRCDARESKHEARERAHTRPLADSPPPISRQYAFLQPHPFLHQQNNFYSFVRLLPRCDVFVRPWLTANCGTKSAASSVGTVVRRASAFLRK